MLERTQIEGILKKTGFVRSKKKSYVFWKDFTTARAFVIIDKQKFSDGVECSPDALEIKTFEVNGEIIDSYVSTYILTAPKDDYEVMHQIKDEYEYWTWRLSGSKCSLCDKKVIGEPFKSWYGFLCSEGCLQRLEIQQGSRCKICSKKFDKDNLAVEHHLSYKDDKTITICRSCHARIHFSKNSLDHKLFKPIDKRNPNHIVEFKDCIVFGV